MVLIIALACSPEARNRHRGGDSPGNSRTVTATSQPFRTRCRQLELPTWSLAERHGVQGLLQDPRGARRRATEKEIKAAYRQARAQAPPRREPGNKKAEARFKEINEANEVLSDPEKRKRYDELGANWDALRPAGRAGPRAGRAAASGSTSRTSGGAGGFSDFFRTFFGGGGGGLRRARASAARRRQAGRRRRGARST